MIDEMIEEHKQETAVKRQTTEMIKSGMPDNYDKLKAMFSQNTQRGEPLSSSNLAMSPGMKQPAVKSQRSGLS